MQMVGRINMALNTFIDLFLPQSEQCGNERVNCLLHEDMKMWSFPGFYIIISTTPNLLRPCRQGRMKDAFKQNYKM